MWYQNPNPNPNPRRLRLLPLIWLINCRKRIWSSVIKRSNPFVPITLSRSSRVVSVEVRNFYVPDWAYKHSCALSHPRDMAHSILSFWKVEIWLNCKCLSLLIIRWRWSQIWRERSEVLPWAAPGQTCQVTEGPPSLKGTQQGHHRGCYSGCCLVTILE